MISPAIVFVHTGYSAYLPITLGLARLTNPGARLFLIGDAANAKVAADHAWSHVDLAALASERLSRFRASYQLIATPTHPDHTLPFDMTRFCFERYFLVTALAERERLETFWMFDSDDLLLEPLAQFQEQLIARGIACTRMAHDSALRGMMNRQVLEDFCSHLIGCFEDASYVGKQKRAMAERPETAAFTDMNAAADFTSPRPSIHLATAVEGWHFDDCILHVDDFAMTSLGWFSRQQVKRVEFDGRNFTGLRGGKTVRFATINGSGLPRQIFPWFLDCSHACLRGHGRPADIRAYQPAVWRELAYLTRARLVGAWRRVAAAGARRTAQGRP